MGVLCRMCKRIKWALFCIATIVGASFLVYCHIEDFKTVSTMAVGTVKFFKSKALYFDRNVPFLIENHADANDILCPILITLAKR